MMKGRETWEGGARRGHRPRHDGSEKTFVLLGGQRNFPAVMGDLSGLRQAGRAATPRRLVQGSGAEVQYFAEVRARDCIGRRPAVTWSIALLTEAACWTSPPPEPASARHSERARRLARLRQLNPTRRLTREGWTREWPARIILRGDSKPADTWLLAPLK